MSSADGLPLRGERVQVRRLSVDDLADFQTYRGDAEVGLYQGWTSKPDAEARAFLAEMQAAPCCALGQWFQLGIAEGPTQRLIGDIGIHRYRSADLIEAEIGFSLSRAAQGRGLAREALGLMIDHLFSQLDVRRIVAITDARNTASIGLLRRLGATLVRSETAIFRGESCIEHRFEIESSSQRL